MSPSWSTSASSIISWISLSVRASPINFMIRPSSLLGDTFTLFIHKIQISILTLDLSIKPFPSPSKTRNASLISSSAFSSFTCDATKWRWSRKTSPWSPSLSEIQGNQCYQCHPCPPESRIEIKTKWISPRPPCPALSHLKNKKSHLIHHILQLGLCWILPNLSENLEFRTKEAHT